MTLSDKTSGRLKAFMKDKGPLVLGVVLCLTFALVLTGVVAAMRTGGANGSYGAYDAFSEPAANMAAESFASGESFDDYDSVETAVADSKNAELTSPAHASKRVYRGSVTLMSSDVDETYGAVISLPGKLGVGTWVESSSSGDGWHSVTMRAESERFADLFESLCRLDVDDVESSMDTIDRGREYADNTRHVKALEKEHDELLELLGRADSVEDVIAVRDRLTVVEYELDMYENTNADIDYDVDWSVIDVRIVKTHVPGTTERDSFFDELHDALAEGWDTLLSFTLAFISLWWLWILIAIVAVIVKAVRRRKAKKTTLSEAPAPTTLASRADVQNIIEMPVKGDGDE